MTSKSSSVANLKAMFEQKSTNGKISNQPRQKRNSKRHSSCDFWESAFKIQQPELMKGPDKMYKEWEHEQKQHQTQQLKPGKIGAWNPQNKWTPNQRDVGRLSISSQFTEQLLSFQERNKSKESAEPESCDDSKNNVMMTCKPDKVEPPSVPQAPKADARAYFSDLLIGPAAALVQGIPYDTTSSYASYSDYVGAGSYPKNREAFPNASRGTFDAIAIDANTRVILWGQENFEGTPLLDITGPALINNMTYKGSYPDIASATFKDSELERNYPPSVRIWSGTNMNAWTNGSVKIVAAAK